MHSSLTDKTKGIERRLRLKGAWTLVAALCVFPIHCFASSPKKGPLNVLPTSGNVTQGGSFTVIWNPLQVDNDVKQNLPPVTVTIVPDPPAVTSQFTPSAVTVIAPSPTTVVIKLASYATPGSVSFTVAPHGPPIPELANIRFSINIIPTTTLASSTSVSKSTTTPPVSITNASSSSSSSSASSSSSSSLLGNETGSAASTTANSETIDSSSISAISTTSGPLSSGPSSQSASKTSTQIDSSSRNGSITSTTSRVDFSTPTSANTQSPNTTSPNLTTSGHNHALSAGQISGITIGLLLLLFILVALFFCWKKKRLLFKIRKPTSEGIDHVGGIRRWKPVNYSNSFGELTVEKATPLGAHDLEGNTRPPDDSIAPSRSYSSDSNDDRDSDRDIREDETLSNSSSSSIPPQYPADVIFTTVEKKQSYGDFNVHDMEELQEQRKKLRELIEVLKERRSSVSSVTIVRDGIVGDL